MKFSNVNFTFLTKFYKRLSDISQAISNRDFAFLEIKFAGL